MTSGSNITPTPPPSPLGAKSVGVVAQIVNIPKVFTINPRNTRVEGEVSGKNNDGSTRIKTPQGDIDIAVNGKDYLKGTKLEIEIPQGSPPRTVTIRPFAPISSPPIQTQPIPIDGDINLAISLQSKQPIPTDGTKQPFLEKPSSIFQSSPLSNTYQPTQPNPQTTPPPPPPVLISGQVVRLTPVASVITPPQTNLVGTPAQVAPITISKPAPTTSQITAIPFTSNLTIQNGVSITKHPTNIVTTPPPTQQGVGPVQTHPNLTAPQTTPPNPNNIKISMTSLPVMPSVLPNVSLKEPVAMQPILQHSKLPVSYGTIDAKIVDIKSSGIVITPTPTKDATQTSSQPQTIIQKQTPTTTIATLQSSPSVLRGVVVGFTPQNLPIVSVTLPTTLSPQNFTLQYPATNLTIGTQITLSPQSTPSAGANSTNAGLTKNILTPLPLWPVMDDIFQTLIQTSPQNAQMMARVLPSPANAQTMGAAAMLFIAAMRSGDIGGWLNDKKVEALIKSGKDNLMRTLSQDTVDSISQKPESAQSEWRSYPLPLLWQNEVSKVMFHIKDHGDDNTKNDGDSATRFIMDISLTRMGDVQLDGLLKKGRLDLIVRTQMPISQAMQETMKIAYANALDGTNIYGELGFQGDIKSWVNVLTREENILSDA